MRLIVEVQAGQLNRRLDTLAEACSDLEPVLKKFGAYLKKKAIGRYKAQNFAPLSAKTIEKRAQKGLRSMEKKLKREIKKAVTKAGGNTRGLSGMVAALGAAQSKKMAVLVEFQRQHRRFKDPSLRAQANGVALTLKAQQSLAKRTVRAVQKAIDRPILGTLPQTLEVNVDRASVELRSHTGRAWTETHNKGGSAGHGAKEPERRTIEVDEEDVAELEKMLIEEHLLPAFEKGAT